MPKNNPHNALFVKTFSIRSEAKAFIQQFLPKWISDSIDYRTFKQATTSYVNEDLKEYFSDIVYECNWKGKKLIQISCLLEHKSYAPQNIYIQLNRYLTEGYQQQSLDKAKKKLTLILPIIIYHGKEKWQQKAFTDYFELPDERLKQYIPNYDYELVDLQKMPNDWLLKLSFGHYLKSTFLVFKHKGDKDFLYQFQEEIFIFVDKKLNETQKRLFVHSMLTYIFAAFKFEPNEVKNYLEILKSDKMVDYIKGSIADHLINEGKEIGKEIGKEEGKKEGKEEGKKLKHAVMSLRSLLLFFSLRANLPMSNIAKIADVGIDTAKKFYKQLETNPTVVSIKKSALSLLFKKITLEAKDHQEIDALIKEFQKKK